MIIKSTIYVMIIQGMGMAVSFTSHLLLARLLGAEEYGVYTYCLTWVMIAVTLSKAGADSAIVKYTSIYFSKQNNTELRNLIAFFTSRIVLVSILAALAILLFSMLFNNGWLDAYLPDLQVAVIIIPILALSTVRQSFLRGVGKVGISNLIDQIIRPSLFLLLFFGLFLTSFINANALYIVLLNAAASTVITMLGIVVARRWFPLSDAPGEISKEQKSKWMKTAGVMTIGTASNLLLKNTDLILVGVLLDPTSTAHYAVASRLANLAAYALNAINVVVQPVFARQYTQGKIDNMQQIMTWVVRFLFLFSLVVWVIVFFAGELALGLFGDSFVDSYTTMIVLVIGITARSFVGPVGTLLNMTGQHNIVSKFMLFGAISNIILNLVLIPMYGIVGAALSTAIVQMIFPLYASRIVIRTIGVNPYIWSRTK